MIPLKKKNEIVMDLMHITNNFNHSRVETRTKIGGIDGFG